jgi:hypothetical protein
MGRLSQSFLPALLLLFAAATDHARANLITYSTPGSTYLGRTVMIPLLPPDYLETGAYSSITDGTLTVNFNAVHTLDPVNMLLFTAGPSSGWPAGWGSAPNTEGYSPDISPQVLYTDYGVSAVLLTFSRPLWTFGLELQPDRPAGGPYSFEAVYYGVGQILGPPVLRTFGDTTGALPVSAQLVAATSTGAPITTVLLFGWDPQRNEPVEWGGARFRYELAPADPSAVPEPSTWALFAGGTASLLLFARNRGGRSKV